jgi:hypothetical protein
MLSGQRRTWRIQKDGQSSSVVGLGVPRATSRAVHRMVLFNSSAGVLSATGSSVRLLRRHGALTVLINAFGDGAVHAVHQQDIRCTRRHIPPLMTLNRGQSLWRSLARAIRKCVIGQPQILSPVTSMHSSISTVAFEIRPRLGGSHRLPSNRTTLDVVLIKNTLYHRVGWSTKPSPRFSLAAAQSAGRFRFRRAGRVFHHFRIIQTDRDDSARANVCAAPFPLTAPTPSKGFSPKGASRAHLRTREERRAAMEALVARLAHRAGE